MADAPTSSQGLERSTDRSESVHGLPAGRSNIDDAGHSATTPTRLTSPGGGLTSAVHLSSSSPFQVAPHNNPHYHHPPAVGHATHHLPPQTASGDAIVGPLPDEGSSSVTSTSRGRVLLPATTAVEVPHMSGYTTPDAKLSLSRPVSPSPSPGHYMRATDASTHAVSGARSVRTSRASSPAHHAYSPVSLMATASNTPSRSRLSPAHSPVISARRSLHFHDPGSAIGMATSQTVSNENAVFERDVEFTQEHLLTGSEAIDLAVPPVLSEVAYGLGDPAERLLSTSPAIVTSSIPEGGVASQANRARHSSAGSPVQNLISFASAADVASSPAMTPLLSVSPSAGRSLGLSQPHSPVISTDQANEGFPQQKVAVALDNLLEPDVPRPSSGLHTDEDDVPDALGSYADRSRRQSFMSYADIINAERSDPHSAMVSPAPSAAINGATSNARHNRSGNKDIVDGVPHNAGADAGSNGLLSGSPAAEGANSPISQSIGSFTQTSPSDMSSEVFASRHATSPANSTTSTIKTEGPSSTWDMLGLGKALNSAADALSGVVGKASPGKHASRE